jgi:hypothetical protein
MTLEDYQQRPKWYAASAEEFRAVLSPLEKRLADHMELVKIPGKKKSTVPVLLTQDMVAAMNIAVKHRHQFGILEDNPYLFPNNLSKAEEPLRAHDCIRKVAHVAGLQHPESH